MGGAGPVPYHRPMSEPPQRSSWQPRISWGPRLLAPLALIAAVLAVFLVVNGSGETGDDTAAAPTAAGKADKGGDGKSGDEGDEDAAETYVVEDGDSLSTIAEDQGISVGKLQKLNPDVDPEALVAGQELKLR